MSSGEPTKKLSNNKKTQRPKTKKQSQPKKTQPPEYIFFITKKWEQKVWDVYFPIIYTNHMACLSFSLCYIPYIFEAILAYIHFALFLGLIIVNIFVKDAEPGQGNRTKASRILWLCKWFIYVVMCVSNVIQLIAGLTGVAKVLPWSDKLDF